MDVECREERRIAGKVQPLAGYDMRIWGRFDNQRNDLGIGLIMRELDKHGFKGTFYVDPFGSLSFGTDGLTEVCAEIQKRGHDLQLHAHPMQRAADWISSEREAVPDRMADYSLEEQAALLEEGMNILERCGVPRGKIVSFRAGHYAANNDTWRAMAKCGLNISSNYNPCYLQKNECRIDWPDVTVAPFDTGLGPCEIPIGNIVEADGGYRHAQITAISLAEMTDFLLRVQKMDVSNTAIVTHSFEFYHIDSVSARRGHPNTVNIHRLRGLTNFLDTHRDKFEVETIAAQAPRMPLPSTRQGKPPPKGLRRLKLARLLQQAYKRAEARLPQLEPLARRFVVP